MSHLPPPSGPPRDVLPLSSPLPPAPTDPWMPSAPAVAVDAGMPLSPRPRKRRRVRAWPFLLGAMALAVGGAGGAIVATWTQADTQYLHDGFVAWSDPVADDVAAIADATGMSAEGELVYRASRPAVEDDDEFSEHCALEGGAVLGCYAAGTIYVYAVTDERLAGTIEVTAAHEMLHAAYERLPTAERERIDALVATAVEAIPEDDPVFDDLDLYASHQQADEWHSRIGTEFADISPELEAHYARYFDDRTLVLALNESAKAAFRAIEAQIDALLAEIDTLGPAIDARAAAYDAAIADFNADVDSFNARASQIGGFSSQAQFNRERAALESRGAALDVEVAAINAEVDRYNGLVEQLTALDADYADLYSALDPSDDPEDVES